MGKKIRKYTWRHKCSKCKFEWKNDTPFFRFDGIPKSRKCPECGYDFFYWEDVPFPQRNDRIIINKDDDEGV